MDSKAHRILGVISSSKKSGRTIRRQAQPLAMLQWMDYGLFLQVLCNRAES